MRDDGVAERRNGAVAQARRKSGAWPIIHSTKPSSSARRCETGEAAGLVYRCRLSLRSAQKVLLPII
jgi:hypothetical protein